MATIAANESRFFFSNEYFSDGELEVVDFVGHEVVSQPFRFELNLLSKNPSVPFSDLVNRQATLKMMWGDEALPIHGVVAHFQQGGPVGSDYYSYRAVLVPRLWRLSLTHRSRIFQETAVPDIIRNVLQEAGLGGADFRLDLSASYRPREYCTQYQETDLAFISRLMEHEGIFYFFEQEDSREVLVMADHRSASPVIEGDDKVAYQPMAGMAVSDQETLHEFVFREQIVTGKVILKDYNYRTPEADLRVESQISDELPGVYYEYGEHYDAAGAGQRLAQVRNEEIECQRRVGTGAGTCQRLRAGHVFTLDKHYRLDLNHGYLITEVTHRGSQRGLVSMQAGDGQAMPYENSFTCIPANVQFRPTRTTPEPSLPGVMTAKIESSGGDYADLDDEGRYRARMDFDIGDAGTAEASLPVRMNQPYSGPGYGIHFPNHADTEMIWACVNGNVDRPLALGTVPNPSQASPSVAENRMQNVIRTASGSEMIFDDTVDKEWIHLKTPNTHTIQLNDEHNAITLLTRDGHTAFLDDPGRQIVLTTKKGHQIVIGDGAGDDKGAAGQHITLSKADGKVYVKLDLSEDSIEVASEEGNIKLRAPKGNIEMESKALLVTTSENAKVKVGTDLESSVGGDVKAEVSGKVEESVGGDVKASVGGKAERSVGGDDKVSVTGSRKVEANEVSHKANMDYKVSAMNVTNEASVDYKAKGLNVSAEASVQHNVKGTMVTVEAAGINTIKGALVKIN